jgi:hypothetical protein
MNIQLNLFALGMSMYYQFLYNLELFYHSGLDLVFVYTLIFFCLEEKKSCLSVYILLFICVKIIFSLLYICQKHLKKKAHQRQL